PHHGEMAHLAGVDAEAVSDEPERFAIETAEKFNAVILLKSSRSLLAGPGGTLLRYTGGCSGLATGGSGDVLAGIIGGLAARGADPLDAAAWGCWLHGHAGEILAQTVGPVGFLAREISPLIPGLLAEQCRAA
ncbi:MAG: ADP/ATP-dependent (S)-NAD(P)H-hydrate dehydratase, partial [Sphingobium sp.]